MPSEFELIARHFARPTPQAVLGPGDDCALLAPSPGMELAITTDMLVDGTHFLPDTDPQRLGWKTLAVNLSDLAAMGACPRWVLLAGSLPTADEAWIAAFADGLRASPNADVRIIGHTDSTGSDAINNPLSLERATSVRNYLADRGVNAAHVQVSGRGSREPIASNDTAEGRAHNRRVEIYVGDRQQG